MNSKYAIRTLGRCCTILMITAACAVAVPLSAISQQSDVASTHQANDDLPALLLMVDGSGSMWGGLGSDGTSKLESTSTSIKTVLPQLALKHRVGLATFGPGCRVASVDVAPEGGSLSAINNLLGKFNPRGKGPLAAGLNAAAETFSEGEIGDIVVFHDGLDNCGADTCAMAASIHTAKPRLKISTISINLDEAEAQAIACVSRATGGYAFNAKTPHDVTTALNEVASKVRAPKTSSPDQLADRAPGANSLDDQSSTGAPRLIATASLVAGGKQASTPLSWRIMNTDGNHVVYETVAPSIVVPLQPGPKIVEVKSGKISVSKNVEIKPAGGTKLDMVLNAGIVRFDTGAKRLASDADEPLIRLDAINPPSKSKSGMANTAAATPLWIARGKAVEALLPPGDYRAVARYGLAHASAPVTVTAGADLNLSLPLEAGRLELNTRPASIKSVVYRISIDDTDQPGGRRELASSAYAQPSFVLSTGSYYVSAMSGTETIQRIVAVRSGEVSKEDFEFGLANLEITATLNGGRPGMDPLLLTIQRQDADKPLTTFDLTTASPGKTVSLPPATYRITLQQGLHNARVSRNVRLEAGDSEKLEIDLKTSEIELDTTAGDGAMTDAICTLRAPDGAIVWRTVKIKFRAVVDPETYSFTCRSGKIVREGSITTAAGQITRVAPFAVGQQ